MKIEDFILLIKSSELNAHLYHWASNSFAAHKALEGYYEAVRSSIDEFVETAQGRFDIKYTIEGTVNVSSMFVRDYYRDLAEVVTKFIDVHLKEYKELENIALEILQEINTLNYLLTLS